MSAVSELDKTSVSRIHGIVSDGLDDIFERIEDNRVRINLKPSEIRTVLNVYYDIGDQWEYWYREGDDEGWE